MEKIVVLRPGALGDVVLTREPLSFLRRYFPRSHLALCAPGERGRLLRRTGFADSFADFEKGSVSWLFSESERAAPADLAAFFSGADLVLGYLDFADPSAGTAFHRRVAALAPNAAIQLWPSRPPAGMAVRAGRWLLDAVLPYAGDGAPGPTESFRPDRIVPPLAATDSPIGGQLAGKRYAVLHPGSGSARKNWGVANFAVAGKRILELRDKDGGQLVDRLVVTSGEADGELGRLLSEALPGSLAQGNLRLDELAALLASAFLYLGNDSGVSHLAGAVATAAGEAPRLAVVFGPSDSGVWSPEGALVLRAGADMRGLDPERAVREIESAVGK